MPIYEYACPDCGHRFEEIQKFSDPPLSLCPKCNQQNVKKLVSATSFVLKGGGWYKDHYGLKSGDSASSSSTSSETTATPAATPPASTPAPAAPAPSPSGST